MSDEAERLGFLSRWSRRKRGEEVPEPEAEPAPELPAMEMPLAEALPVEACPVEACPVEAPPAEPEFDVASLPPIESLTTESDFSVFLKPGVPQALRTAALRKAWTADPLIRDYMSPLDYAWDFNTPGGLPHGFSNVLAETGEALRKLISQAIGEIEPEEEKPEALALADAPPLEVALEDTADAALLELPDAEGLAPPSDAPIMEFGPPIRLSEPPIPVLTPPAEEAPPPPRRRHGGAIPA